MSKLNIKLVISGGIVNILMGVFHLSLWFLFNWSESLSTLSQLNRNIMLMLNFSLTMLLFCAGIIMIVQRIKILNSSLGRSFLLCFGSFYLLRFILEFVLPGAEYFLGLFLLVTAGLHFIPIFKVKDTKESVVNQVQA